MFGALDRKTSGFYCVCATLVGGQHKNQWFYCVFCVGPRPRLLKPLVLLCFWSLGIKNQWLLQRFINSGRGPTQKPIVLLGFLLWPPTKVAETNSFTVFLEPWIKKPMVCIAFDQFWSRANAKTISFTVCFALAPDQGC